MYPECHVDERLLQKKTKTSIIVTARGVHFSPVVLKKKQFLAQTLSFVHYM